MWYTFNNVFIVIFSFFILLLLSFSIIILNAHHHHYREQLYDSLLDIDNIVEHKPKLSKYIEQLDGKRCQFPSLLVLETGI